MMRIPSLGIVLLLILNGLRSQTIVITFEGTLNGSPLPLDSIVVMNLTQGGDTTIYFPEHVLVLGTVGIDDAGHPEGLRLSSLPNPFAGHTDVLVDAEGGDLLLTLQDAMGRSLATLALAPAAGIHRFSVGCEVPGIHYLTAVQGGVRRTVRLMATEGSGRVGLVHLGGVDRPAPKDDRALFTWMPGDELRYIGYATGGGVSYGAAIDEVPVMSATRTFIMAAGAACPFLPSVTDIDGNTYPTVQIGNQCWMAGNLRTSTYNDGSAIPNVTGDTAWTQLNSGAWCSHQNDSSYDATYGKLYNWFAAANPTICPQGWHVPTDAEWQHLEAALGMPAGELAYTEWRGAAQNVGGKMKATILWFAPNTGATNESGFSGLPGPVRSGSTGAFAGLTAAIYWWSASERFAESAWERHLEYNKAGINRSSPGKSNGFCVRCIMD